MGRRLVSEELSELESSTAYRELSEPLPVGAQAPDFDWTDDDGQRVRLSDLRGQPVLLAFFGAHWDPARTHQLWVYNQVLGQLPSGGRVLGLAQGGRWCEVMLGDEEAMRFP